MPTGAKFKGFLMGSSLPKGRGPKSSVNKDTGRNTLGFIEPIGLHDLESSENSEPVESVEEGNCMDTVVTSREANGEKNAPQKKGGTSSQDAHGLRQCWEQVKQKFEKEGVLHVHTEESKPMWIAASDKARTYRSLVVDAQFTGIRNRLHEIQMIVDTGAGVSLLAEREWKRMKKKTEVLEITDIELYAASGHPLKVLGLTNVRIQVNHQWIEMAILIVRDLSVSMLLGVDFLATSGASIHFQSNTLKIPGLRDISVESTAPNLLRTVSTMVLPKQAHTVFAVNVSAKEGIDIMVESCRLGPHVYLARSVGAVRNGQVMVQVTNVNTKDVEWSAGRYCGTWEEVKGEIRSDIGKKERSSEKVDILPVIDANESNIRGEKTGEEKMAQALEESKRQDLKELKQGSAERTWITGLDHLSESRQQQLRAALEPFKSLFVTGQTKMPRQATDCVARIEGGEDDPVALKPYRTPFWKRKLIDEQVQDLLEQNVIQPSLSAWSSPVVLVEKPGQPGKWRLCIDYREVNKRVQAVTWPLPRMDESIGQLAGAEWITCLDLAWGFWALPLDEPSQPKTAFCTENGHFEWRRMPMGWQGAPPTFQQSMDLLLHGIKGVNALCYIDDLVVYSMTFEEHLEHLVEVCRRLFMANRSIRLEKAQWAQQTVKFLGFEVGRGQVRAIQEKVEKVLTLPRPRSLAALRAFLGGVGVYRSMMPQCSQIASPLYKCLGKLTKKQHAQPELDGHQVMIEDEWDAQCTVALEQLRNGLTQLADLELPQKDVRQAIRVEGDPSGFQAVFEQEVDDQWRPLAYYSGTFSVGEGKKSGAERIVLALRYVMDKVHVYLNPRQTLLVYTSEPEVAWALEPNNVVGKVARSAMWLARFPMKIELNKKKIGRGGQVLSYNDAEARRKYLLDKKSRQEDRDKTIVLEEPTKLKLEDAWVVTFDGGYRRTENQGGRGWTVWHVTSGHWELIRAEGHRREDTTVNKEEFGSLINALTYVSQLDVKDVHVFGDSKFVIGAMQGRLKCRSASMKELHQQAAAVIKTIRGQVKCWHITRQWNAAADKMANLAMDLKASMVSRGKRTSVTLELIELGKDLMKRCDGPWICAVETRAQTQLAAKQLAQDEFDKEARWEIIRKGQRNTPWMAEVIDWLEKGGYRKRDRQDYEMCHGLLWVVPKGSQGWRLVLPQSLRWEVLEEMHGAPWAGHLRGLKFLEKVRSRYYWPGLATDVNTWQNGCIHCQQGKTALWRQTVPLAQIRVETNRPFQCIAVDSVVNLQTSTKGNCHMIVLVDYFSRWPIVIPVKDLTMKTWLKAFIENVISVYGCPERLVSDRGGQFIGDLAKALYRHLRIKSNPTTAYHPMANGLVERFNGTLHQGLKTLAKENQTNWDEVLPYFLLAYRTSVHPVTKCTPYEVVFGQAARLPYDVMLREFEDDGLNETCQEFVRFRLRTLGRQRQRVRELNQEGRVRQGLQYNKGKKQRQFVAGDRVWLYHPVVPKGVKRKQYNLWRGPFKVLDRVSDVDYRLELTSGSRCHDTVHINRLAPFVDRGQWLPPPEEDMELGPRLVLPEDYQDLDIGDDVLPSKIVELVDHKKNVNGEVVYLAKCRSNDGTEEAMQWVHHKRIIAGDLIHRYWTKRRLMEMGTLLQATAPGARLAVGVASQRECPTSRWDVRIPIIDKFRNVEVRGDESNIASGKLKQKVDGRKVTFEVCANGFDRTF